MKPRAVVLRFVPSKAGTITHVSGFSAEAEIEGVIAEPMVTVGQNLGRAASDGDRMAYILATADTIEEALARTDAREARIRITIDSAI